MMSFYKIIIICCAFSIILTTAIAETNQHTFEYYHPRAGAKYVSPETNIAIRQSDLLSRENDLTQIATITGSLSGTHSYRALISDDNRTIVLQPDIAFSPGEKVAITLNPGLKAINGELLDSISWDFTITSTTEKVHAHSEYTKPKSTNNGDINFIKNSYYSPSDTIDLEYDVILPSNFPDRYVLTSGETDSGYVFLSNFYGDDIQYLMILDNEARPIYFQRVPENTFDFKKQPNGLLTYYTYYTYQFYAMDSTYTVVDSFQCGNGYEHDTDPHDLQILDNGHALMIAYDGQYIDMSQYVEECEVRNSLVYGLIVQELDTLKNVIWEWRSWDHIEFTDATWDINLCSSRVDYVHGNTVELDSDGNLLISSRNLDEITKINRTTGDIIWRLGGENNMFTFLNDTRPFSHQHDIRRLPNGNITLYDNGNLNSPFYSRAVEYELDEVNFTATKVWEFRQTPDVAAGVMGNTQRLASGHTVIGWGSARPNVTELNENDEKVWEMHFNNSVISYRAFRFPWHGIAARPYLIGEEFAGGIHLIFNKFGDANVAYFKIYLNLNTEPSTLIDSTSEKYIDITGLQAGYYYARVTAVDSTGFESEYSNIIEFEYAPNFLYLPGDINMYAGNWPPVTTGADVTYLVNLFRGLPETPACFMLGFFAAADVNGSCMINGSDVTYLVNYFRGLNPLTFCPDFHTPWPDMDHLPYGRPHGWPECDE